LALTAESLSVWDISFRWAGFDPDKLWLRFPLPVKDNFKLLLDAIHGGEILCETLTLAKRPRDSKADPSFYIRTYLDDIHDCVNGSRYSRKLLKWAVLGRENFRGWCDNRGIQYPEFWFPPGWKLNFETPEGGTLAMWAEHVEPDSEGNVHISYKNYPGLGDNVKPSDDSGLSGNREALRDNQRIRVACCQIAQEIWKKEPTRTITSVVEDDLIQQYGGANHYEKDTVRRWIKEVAPQEVRSRRGRPPKNKDKEQ